MLFNEKYYGKPISKQLSEIIKKHTTRWERIEDCRGTSLSSDSYIAKLLTGERPLTKENAEGVKKMCRTAFAATLKTSLESKSEGEYLLDVLEASQEELLEQMDISEFEEIKSHQTSIPQL